MSLEARPRAAEAVPRGHGSHLGVGVGVWVGVGVGVGLTVGLGISVKEVTGCNPFHM